MERKVVSMEAKLLAVFTAGIEVNVRRLCAELGISRQSFYKYRRRWAAEGPAGLVERSRRPLRSPAETPVVVEDEIVRLRKGLRVDNGAQAIAWQLGRGGTLVSAATVHRILVRRGMVIPRPERRPKSSWRRFEWPRPNDAWQIDATQWVLSDNREVWIMDVLDDHSRVLVAARVCDGPTGAAAWDALGHAIAEWGVPAHVMSDNGSCFTARFASYSTGTTETDFERSLRGLGVRHICSSPAHPQTCGKLERSHQTTKRWLATAGLVDTAEQLQNQLDRWRQHYNNHRPHKAAGGGTPTERWTATPRAAPGAPIPARSRASLHIVSANGSIGWHDFVVGIDRQMRGERVLVIANGNRLTIHGRAGIIRTLEIDSHRRYQPTGLPPGRRPRSVNDVPTHV
jgi:transposase InsO family protein